MNTEGVIDTETKAFEGWEFDIAHYEMDNTVIATRNFESMAGLTVIDANNGEEMRRFDLDEYLHPVSLGGIAIQNETAICCSSVGVLEVELGGGSENSIINDTPLDKNCYIDADEENIYFSNMNSGTVTCCDFNGDIKWIFKDEILQYPSGIGVDSDGNVYVAGYQTDNIVVISADGTRSRELLTKENCIDKPRALCLDKKRNKLLVANSYNEKTLLCSVYQESFHLNDFYV